MMLFDIWGNGKQIVRDKYENTLERLKHIKCLLKLTAFVCGNLISSINNYSG
jgi:hypothetical protein